MVHHVATVLWHFLLLLLWPIKIAETMTSQHISSRSYTNTYFQILSFQDIQLLLKYSWKRPPARKLCHFTLCKAEMLFPSCLQSVYKETAHLWSPGGHVEDRIHKIYGSMYLLGRRWRKIVICITLNHSHFNSTRTIKRICKNIHSKLLLVIFRLFFFFVNL